MLKTIGFKGKKSSNKALKTLLVMLFFLLSASFLAPDVVEIWASTQKNDWRRDLAQEWSEPVGELSRKAKISEIREKSKEIIESSNTESFLLPLSLPTVPSTSLLLGDLSESSKKTTTKPKATQANTQSSYQEIPVQSSLEEIVTDNEIIVETTSTLLPSVSSTTSTTTSMPTGDSVAALRQATDEKPLKVLAVGDSLMLDFQYGLERIIEPRPDLEVEGRGALGFGFTVPHWDWEDDVIPDYNLMVGEVRPDVVTVMIGANEFQGYAIEGEDLEPGSRRWREVLTKRAHDAVSHWLADGAYLYWWTTPKMSDPSYLVDDLNSVWEEVVAAWAPRAKMVESMKVLGDEEGAFKWNIEMPDGSILPLRKEHGVHFFEVGADALSVQFEELLVEDGWLKDLQPVS